MLLVAQHQHMLFGTLNNVGGPTCGIWHNVGGPTAIIYHQNEIYLSWVARICKYWSQMGKYWSLDVEVLVPGCGNTGPWLFQIVPENAAGKSWEQAGAEQCQAQEKLGLAKLR